MASKKQRDHDKAGLGSGPRRAHTARARKHAGPGATGNSPRERPQDATAAFSDTEGPSQGLDATRHAVAQRAAHQAEVLRKGVFPALMASALAFDQFFDTAAYNIYLEQILADAGNPTDPIERMLIEQLCLAHFRIAQLHVGAGQAKGAEAVKLYNSASARMLGEFRRTALALRVYKARTPEGKAEGRLRIFKMAQ